MCGCVDIIVWAGREVSGWDSLDCSNPLSVCLLVGVAVIVSVCGGVGIIVWSRRGVSRWGSFDFSSPLSVSDWVWVRV